MKLNKRYRLTLEDESSLEKKVDVSTRLPWLILILIALTVLAGAFGMFVLASSPMKNYLPGYLKESERTATEEQHLRLDSLVKVYEINEAYITGLLNALNPTEKPVVKDSVDRKPMPLTLDSLLPISEEEKQFMEDIRERDKYNIMYAAPVAAQSLMFGSVNNGAVFSQDTKNKHKATIILPDGAPVACVAEGKVISVVAPPNGSGSYEVIIQHPKGFLSRCGNLSNVVVKPGDRVSEGDIIATKTGASGKKSNQITFELWRDGDPLIPAEYLNKGGNHKN